MNNNNEPKHSVRVSVPLVGGLLLVLFFGALAGWYTRLWYFRRNLERLDIEQTREVTSGAKYKFINPLLTCDLTYKKDLQQFLVLKEAINKVIQTHVAANDVQTVSIYFDTRDGKWLGINTNELYFPASLMKVPLMIAYLKKSETHPEVLNKKIWYDGSFNLNVIEYFRAPSTLTANHFYTVDELLNRMIVNSGNNSTVLLANNIESSILEGIYNDLGVSLSAADSVALPDYMTVKSYSNFFRILYNASYLNRAMSEKALNILSQATFDRGIRAGVPTATLVADKFGERNNSNDPQDPTSAKQLHDCGIVYYPDHPYLLCIMTKGTNFEKLAAALKDISETVYRFVDAQKLAQTTP